MKGATFNGYIRPDGSVGIRNHVVVIPTVACANGVADMISRSVPGVVSLMHGHGCGRALEIPMHQRALAGLGENPNVAGALVIGLGCETLNAQLIASEIAQTGKPAEFLIIQEQGGSRKTAAQGIDIVQKMLETVRNMKRTPCSLDRIVLGLECGGSDAFSGITANPAAGLVSDWLVDRGGTVILTETTEMIGTGHILSRRAKDKDVADRIVQIIDQADKRTHDILGELASLVIAPGNMDGGMSSIQEKSLGCIIKAGSKTISEVVDYARAPSEKGLVIMDGPGYDIESLAGLAAAGCQLMLFTTGRGNPAGFPIVPVIKISSTTRLYKAMEDDIDINAGEVLEGKSLEDVSGRIRDCVMDVLNGEQTKAELNAQGGIVCLYAMTPAF
ncbi:MAG TPA: UxaA family hydrolase [Deltaproteobacteria bacterium]|nr:UxaA family hydrolase [Deltaproteobacteria bacterium]HPJ94257.1 UxaA family hydrolase [Deltaproteobacteria bacterium]HPR51483.1 UxaA family hydrolase [Deltaproteobacteria bacterium]